jgi:hypothetical protein
MFDAQLEMSFGEPGRFATRRQRRLSRAQWWFDRMRKAVDRALDWQPAPPPRPEQIWLPTALGPIEPGSGTALRAKAADERQMCE